VLGHARRPRLAVPTLRLGRLRNGLLPAQRPSRRFLVYLPPRVDAALGCARGSAGLGDIAEAFRRARSEAGAAADLKGEPAKLGPDRAPRGVKRPAEVAPARIPETRDADWPTRAVWVEKHGPVAEAFRHLALQVRKELAARSASSVLVVSCDRAEGKTLTACNLALALASLSGGERIALAELDLRRPALARGLGLRVEVGLEDVLAGEAALENCWIPTEIPALDLYPVRQRVAHPHEWLARPGLARTLRQLERSYSAVVCDGPPALVLPDVEILAPHVGAYLPVVRAGQTSRSAYAELVGMLPRAKLIGTFLNCARPPRHTRHFYRDADYAAPQREDEGA